MLYVSDPQGMNRDARRMSLDALRDLNAPDYVIRRIVGHASSSVTDGYGSGASLKTCSEWINKVALLDALPPGSAEDSP